MLVHPDARFDLRPTAEQHGHWDPERLAQVVSNLASNAIHYGRPGAPIVVDITADAERVTLAVTNELRERPIPPETLNVLFDPHRRGTDARHNQAGLGLGLYIVHQIVRAHDGEISASSDDSGTVFRVVLPRNSG